jgi:hypothetical protein
MAKKDEKGIKVVTDHGPAGFVGFVAWVGAFMYFAQGANEFGDFIWAFLQACVWPAILLFNVLAMLKV